MRIDIELDDELVERAMQLTSLETESTVVEEALENLVRFREQAEARALRGKLRWEGDLERMRESRFAGSG